MSILQQWSAASGEVVTRGWDSLVRVYDGIGAGAGTIWHADGLIITNAHVVVRDGQRFRRGWGRRTAQSELRVTLVDGRDFAARVLGADEESDLAALVIDAEDLPTIEVGTSKDVRAGQWVTALGHPWGVHGAATSGVVIGAGKNLPDMPLADREWIALGLHLRPGHSGGPLLDSDGRLIGINTMITGPDVGFAVPVDRVKAFLRDVMEQQGQAIPASRRTTPNDEGAAFV